MPAETGQPLRILVVTQYFWPENFQINHVVSALRERGHVVTVLTGKPNYPGGKFFDGYSMFGKKSDTFEGIPVIRVPLMPRGTGNGVRLALNYLSFALSASILGVRRLQDDYDVIFTYEPSPITVGLPAIFAKRRKGAPILFWVQDLWPESVSAAGGFSFPPILSAIEYLVRFIYRRCDRVLIQSNAFRPNVVKSGANSDDVIYFPQSVNSMFRPLPREDAPVQGDLMPTGFNLVFAGNIGQAQDFETIVAAAEQLRDITDINWVIIGDGRRRTWLENEVSRRGLSDCFHLLGSFPEEDMPRFFTHADALLVTLRREPIFALTIPTKVQAYLACGKPIIASMDGEGGRIIDEAGAGHSVPASDAEKLAGAVKKMYDLTSAEREKMGANALAYSRQHFDPDSQIDHLVKLMRTVAAPPQ